MIRIAALWIFVFIISNIYGQEISPLKSKMQWFKDAKLGIFIHWGLYSVDGIDESWSFYNGYISHEDYIKQKKGFDASKYNPEKWVDFIQKSGAKYAVITAKHHDGFSLWDTAYNDFSAVKSSAAKTDVLSPFINALREANLKVGVYFSLPDWTYQNYTHFTRDSIRYKIEDDPDRWSDFLTYCHGQLKEISTMYNPDLLWFDGDWEHTSDEWQSAKIRSFLTENNPGLIINSRLTGHGDYATPEQGAPIFKPSDPFWELCLTMNDSWGFQKTDHNYKTATQLIGIFCDVIGNGGNLLLDIGPKSDGTIPSEQKELLKQIGNWTSKHQEAIYGSLAGIPKDYYHGSSTLSKDSTILYLFVKGNPGNQVVIRGLKNDINRVWVVGQGAKLSHEVKGKVYWSAYPGIKYINVPEHVIDEHMTVLAVLLDGKIRLYRDD